jgi:hypothetical protein
MKSRTVTGASSGIGGDRRFLIRTQLNRARKDLTASLGVQVTPAAKGFLRGT